MYSAKPRWSSGDDLYRQYIRQPELRSRIKKLKAKFTNHGYQRKQCIQFILYCIK